MDVKKILDWYQSRQQRIKEAIQAPIYAAKILRTFFSKGAVEIATSFEYNGKTYGYETIVQLDGDIVFYLPNPRSMDQKGIETMKSAYLSHKLNVEKVVRALEDNTQFFNRIFDGFLFVINFYPLLHLLEELLQLLGIEKGDFEASTFGWNSVFVIASLLVRRFLRPQIFSLVLKAITAIGKYFKWF
jgi:hypothetical protein